MDQTSHFSSSSTDHVRQHSRRRVIPAKINTPERKISQERPMSQALSSPRQRVLEKETKEYCGRDRLKRHREEVAGAVMIPDIWGQESLLNDWIDYSSFDKLLAPAGHASAREALVASSQRLRIESRC